jgi:hypothetical protein
MRANRRSKTWGRFLAGFTLAMLIGLGAGAADTETVYGHKIPPFKTVFIKVFRSYLLSSSLEQLRTTSSQLTDRERASISYYLGEDGHNQVKTGLPKEKQDFLEKKYIIHTQIAYEPDFHKVYPHILATAGNGLTPEQWKKLLDGMSVEELASQNFWLAGDGRKVFYTELTQNRIQIYIDHVQDWQIIAEGKRMLNGLRDYTCIMYKQERIDGNLQGVEKILLKYRDKPLGIYMKWLEGPWQGREVLFNSKIHKPGWARARESGVLGIMAVTAPIDSEIFRRGTNHLLNETGFRYYIERNEKEYLKAQGKIKHRRYGIVDLNGVKVYQFESILPREPGKYYAYRTMEWFDYANALPIKSEIYNFDNQLQESFHYTLIKVNPGLTENDFNPDNPDYNLQ